MKHIEKIRVDLSEKQLGTLIAYMINGIADREHIKAAAHKAEVRHLDGMDDEYKLLLKFTELYKQLISK